MESNQLPMTPKQLTSALAKARAAAKGISNDGMKRWRISKSLIHFHDKSTTEIVWNDVEAIQAFNEFTGENLPVPLVATEGSNMHYHTSDLDGGYIPGTGPHDHRDNFNGGFAFAVFHPGTDVPEMPFAI